MIYYSAEKRKDRRHDEAPAVDDYMHEQYAKPKILVVDDEKLVRMSTCAKLKRAGYECVAAGDVETAVAAVKSAPHSFGAVISDISMGGIDGFAFRDILRGVEPTLPVFFLTAMDPEEGSGFLRKILADPISYYLPKSVSTEVLVNRVRQIVASRRVGMFIESKIEEDKKALHLASHIQRSLLPQRAAMDDRSFYATWWHPMEIVSGDLVEAVQLGDDKWLYILGDIQGHGTEAALAMTAAQTYLKQISHSKAAQHTGVAEFANMMHRFFRTNLTDVSYMTALVCIHDLAAGEVEWISCGAPDLQVVCRGKPIDANPGKKGGLPIGLMPDTEYGPDDIVKTKLPPGAACLAFSDGIYEMSHDEEAIEKIPVSLLREIRDAVQSETLSNGSIMVSPVKLMGVCENYGYDKFNDDVALLAFGPRVANEGIYEATVVVQPEFIDKAAAEIAEWCVGEGLDETVASLVQLVFEEKLMNVHDHGFEDRDLLREAVSARILVRNGRVELTVWDYGSPEPSIQVSAGDPSTYFENANRAMHDHGRGRLMIREICECVERNRIMNMNETIYYIPASMESAGNFEKMAGGGG